MASSPPPKAVLLLVGIALASCAQIAEAPRPSPALEAARAFYLPPGRELEVSQPVVVADAVGHARYVHYPSMATSPDGRLHLVYYRGANHGQAEIEGVSRAAEHPPGPMPIDGTRSVDGRVTLTTPTRVFAYARRGRPRGSIRVYGLDQDGRAASALVRIGPGAGVGSGATRFSAISRATLNANGPVDVALGLYMVPSTIEYRYSDDRGVSWSAPRTLSADSGRYFNYNPVVGVAGDGEVAVLWTRFDINARRGGEPGEIVGQRSLSNGGSWLAAPERIDLGVDLGGVRGLTEAGRAPAIYGRLATLPGGGLVGSIYSGRRNWTIRSDDGGRSWLAREVPAPKGVVLSELSLAVVSDRHWVAVSRTHQPGSSPLRQLVTYDGGLTWADRGELPFPPGAYVSPDLQVLSDAAGPVLMLTAVTRNDEGPPSADSLIVHYARLSDAVEASPDATAWGLWSQEHVLIDDGLEGRSGYPAVSVASDGEAVFVFGREDNTGEPFDPRAARLETVRWNVDRGLQRWLAARRPERTLVGSAQ